MNKKLRKIAGLSIIFFCSYAGAEEGNNRPTMEEVVITVERRETNLQDLAGTASAFTGEELSQIGLQNLTDLSESVVGLEIGNNKGNVEVWIRGVGSANNTELGDPAAAMHIDGVYIPRPRGIGGAFFDLERVEINVGPQGTLRGRNAMAGSINAIPWKPGLGIWNVALESEIGNYDQFINQLVVNAPLGEKVATRLALLKQDHDAYYNDVGPRNLEAPESADNHASRLQFLFKPMDQLTLLLSGDYLSEKGTGYTGTNYANPLGNDIDANDIDDPRDVYLRGFSPEQDTKHWGAKLEIDYEFDNSSIEFIYGHRDLVYNYKAATPLSPDYPGVVQNLGGINLNESIDNYSFFQEVTDSVSDIYELRYFTSQERDIYFTTGVFYFLENQYTFLGGTQDGDLGGQGFEFNQPNTDTESFSIYGDATWKFAEDSRLTVGLRWTDDHKERQGVNAQYRVGGIGENSATGQQFDDLGFRIGTEGFEFAVQDRTIFNPDIDGDGQVSNEEYFRFVLDGVSSWGARDNFDDALINTLNGVPTPCIDTRLDDDFICSGPNYGAIFAKVPLTSVAPQDGEINSSFLDWRIRLEHDITEDNLLYGLIATGHKSGGFNDTFAIMYRGFTPADGVCRFPDVPGGPGEPACLRLVFSEADAEIVRYQNGAGGLDATYDEERVTFYELGSKNEFDLGTIPTRFNASLFFQDYRDQVFCNVTDPVSLVQGSQQGGESTQRLKVNYCFNTGKSEIYGSQIDADLYLPYEFTFKLSGLWLETEIVESDLVIDSRFQSDIDLAGSGLVDIQGNNLPHAPQFSLNLSLSQKLDFSFASIDYIISAAWRDEQHLTIFNGVDYQQPNNPRARLDDRVPAYWTYDFGAGMNIADTNFRFETFVNNITNEVRPAAILVVQFDNTRFFTRPRTYGFRVKWQL